MTMPAKMWRQPNEFQMWISVPNEDHTNVDTALKDKKW